MNDFPGGPGQGPDPEIIYIPPALHADQEPYADDEVRDVPSEEARDEPYGREEPPEPGGDDPRG